MDASARTFAASLLASRGRVDVEQRPRKSGRARFIFFVLLIFMLNCILCVYALATQLHSRPNSICAVREACWSSTDNAVHFVLTQGHPQAPVFNFLRCFKRPWLELRKFFQQSLRWYSLWWWRVRQATHVNMPPRPATHFLWIVRIVEKPWRHRSDAWDASPSSTWAPNEAER